MSFKLYIDTMRFKKLSSETCFLISGWCFSTAGDPVTYKVKVDGINREFEKKEISRKDVTEKMVKYHPPLSCGFSIKVPMNYLEEPKTLELFACSKEGEKKIVSLNEAKIRKITDSKSISYHLEHIRADKTSAGIKYEIGGWAFSEKKSSAEVEYQILDSAGNEMKHTFRIINRDDLYRLGMIKKENKYCGFSMEFLGDENQEYTFIIRDGDNSVRKKLVYAEVERMNRRMSQIGTVKTIIKNFNGENIIKGCVYLKKNGPRKLIRRLKKGVHVNGMPYSEWYEHHKVTEEELSRQRAYKFEYNPKYSIIVPTYNTPIQFLREMIDSVTAQTYPNWELCIGDGSEGNPQLEAVLAEYAEKDPRIKYQILEKNFGIAGNTNGALELATGEYIGLFDHDDILGPNALYEVTKALQKEKYDIIYTDEDKVSGDLSEHMDPNFKPDWSPDLFYSHNYITHFFVVKKSIVDKIGGFRSEYDGSQDYDLMFRCIENAESIKHIPMILYHWRMHGGSVAENPASKMYAYEAGRKAIEGHFERTGIQAKVEIMPCWGMYHVIYETPGNPLVSVIIPNKDHVADLDTCIQSLFEKNSYQNFEIIIIENNSEEKKTFEYYEEIQKQHDNVKVVTWEHEFNYSAINNFGVGFAKGEYLLFLNNDTEVINETAISELLGCCMREDVGIVGAKLLYEDDTVQHAGIVLGFGGFAGHVFTGIDKDDYGYMVRPRINCNYSAVTAACMMVDRKVFEEVGGFREEFKVGLNDVDFCLKVRETGKLVVYNAHSLWHHYESKSRGYEDTPEKIKRFQGEIALFQKYWGELLKKGDPYYNKNFPIEYGPFRLG